MFTIEIYGNANWECSYTMQAAYQDAYVCASCLLFNLNLVDVDVSRKSVKNYKLKVNFRGVG